MKKIALLLMALTTSALASAEVPMKEFCPQIAGVARVTMEARQMGVPMRNMMEVAADDTLIDMIIEAYGHSAYSTQEYKERAIQDFEDHWYMRCVEYYNQ